MNVCLFILLGQHKMKICVTQNLLVQVSLVQKQSKDQTEVLIINNINFM